MRSPRFTLTFASTFAAGIMLSGCGSAHLMSTSSPEAPGSAPSVMAVGVQDNGVAPNRWQYVQFSEAMDPATINAETFAIADGSGKAVPGSVVYYASFGVAGFQPHPALQTDTSYTATITTGVASAQGVRMAKPYTYDFTTRATTDTSPLYVASVTPVPNTSCVSATAPITITFSEGVDVSTLTSANILITGPGGNIIPARINYDVATAIATLTPTSPLRTGTVTVSVEERIADAAGVPMASAYIWSFQTACGGGGSASGNEYLYVSLSTTQDIYAFHIDAATGNLASVADQPFQWNGGAAVLPCDGPGCWNTFLADPIGRYLFYDFTWENNGFGTMTVDPKTGSLTQNDVLVDPPTTETPQQGISFDPQGRFVFGTASNGQNNWIRSIVIGSNGHLSPAPGDPFPFPGQTAYGAPAVSNQFVFVSDYAFPGDLYGFSIDQNSGAPSAVSTTPDGQKGSAQVITPSGKFLYAERVSQTTGTLEIAGYQVNSDGSLKPLPQAPQQTPDEPGVFLIMSPNGNFLYHQGQSFAPATAGQETRAYAIDQNTGALSLTAVYTDLPRPFFSGVPLAIDPAVKYVYVAGASQSGTTANYFLTGFTVKPTTGALTPIAGLQIPIPAHPSSVVIVRPQ